MANFDYTKDDLFRSFNDVMGENLRVEDFGFSSSDYLRVDELECHLTQLNNIEITDTLVKKYNFEDVGNFMDVFCRAHLWNNYKMFPEQTIGEFMMNYHIKAARYHKNDNIPIPSSDGNLLTYLKMYEPTWLLSIGW